MERRVFNKVVLQLVGCGGYGLCVNLIFGQTANTPRPANPTVPNKRSDRSTDSHNHAVPESSEWKLYRFDELGFHGYFPSPPKPSPTATPVAQAYEAWINSHRLRVAVVPSKVASVYNQNILEGFLEAKQRAGRKINHYSLLANNVLTSASTNWEIINNQNALVQHQELDILQIGWSCNVSVSPIQNLYDETIAKRFFNGIKIVPPATSQSQKSLDGVTSSNTKYTACRTCGGDGSIKQTCSYCLGTRVTTPALRSVEGYTCRWCYGTGYRQASCSACYGTGKIAVRR